MEKYEKVKLWRERFNGRSDVFGQIFTKIERGKKKPKKAVTPVYIPKYRYDKALRKEAVKTAESAEELYEPLTKDQVEAHLEGRVEVMIYLPRLDGTTNFFALDFDFIHGFDETQKVSKALAYHKIPHYIARSTTKGHHIYVFMDEPIQAFYIHNFVRAIYEDLGYKEMVENKTIVGQDDQGKDIRWQNPEIFPKTTRISTSISTGYGIKPAMYGKAMEKDQCCFVDINDKVIGGSGKSDEQWDYLKNAKKMKTKNFIKIIEELGIEVDEDLRMSESRGAVKQLDRKRAVPYEKPKDGDFMLVINGCPALRRMWESPAKDMPHSARVALLSMALRCRNGVEIIREKFGDSKMTNDQIAYAMETSQHPWCCKTLQDYDICSKGKDPVKASGKATDREGNILTDFCFEKSPPIERVGGKIKINPKNLPEEEWPWPSPIRLKSPRTENIVSKYKKDIDQLNIDHPSFKENFRSLITSILDLKNKGAREKTIKYLRERKLVSIDKFKDILSEEKKDKVEDTKRKLEASGGVRFSNGLSFIENDPSGYSIVKVDTDGQKTFFPISNFSIHFYEDRKVTSVLGGIERYFVGEVICSEEKKKFKITADDYSSKIKFSKAIFLALGPKAQFNSNNIDHIRAAISVFGLDEKKEITVHENHGFDSWKKPSVYKTTTGLISKDGFYSVDEASEVVVFSDKQIASQLGLKGLDDSRFKHVARIIIDNVLYLSSFDLTIPVISHSFQSLIHNPYIPVSCYPSLWLQGTTGVGKSFLGFSVQHFHGDFDSLYSVQSTVRSIEQTVMSFKDCLLVIDDYKKGSTNSIGIADFIQKHYDGNKRSRLNPDLNQSEAVSGRGLLMFTGEDPPSEQASVLSRTLYLEAKELLKGSDDEVNNYKTVCSVLKELSGVSSRFIQYMLCVYQDPKPLHEEFFELRAVLGKNISSVQNGPRILDNLTANYFTWELVLKFFIKEDIISKGEFEELRAIHFENIKKLLLRMLSLCNEGQASERFLSLLEQAIVSGKYCLERKVAGDSLYLGKEKVGFYDGEREHIAYIYPDIAIKAVKSIAGDGAVLSSKQAISSQLLEAGVLARRSANTNSYKKRDLGGKSRNTWCIDLKKAGILGFNESEDEGKNDTGELTLPYQLM